jgi:hypothetical protein
MAAAPDLMLPDDGCPVHNELLDRGRVGADQVKVDAVLGQLRLGGFVEVPGGLAPVRIGAEANASVLPVSSERPSAADQKPASFSTSWQST